MPAARRVSQSDAAEAVLRLTYRPPLAWDALLDFLGKRAIPGVERVTGGEYRRTIAIGNVRGTVRVTHPRRGRIEARVPPRFARFERQVAARLTALFDLAADPRAIARDLGRDELLAPLVARWPGIRVPGAWDPFELAVRAVVGQQVSVAAATTLMGRLAAAFGDPVATGDPETTLLFPPAAVLAGAEIAGMPLSRAEAVRAVAADFLRPGPRSIDELTSIRGVGPWTANYIAMRAFRDPDAFPHGDLVLRRAAGGLDARQLEARAEAWRPWRAYAAMLLWRGPG